MALDPLPTQVADADFLVSHRHPALFSEPGTGKTITALEGWKRAGGRLCVVAPPIALRMWQRNIQDHLGARAQVLTTGKDLLDKTADAHVVSYSLAGKFPALRGADVLVLDESDALKSLTSQRTETIFGQRAKMQDCLAEGVEHVWPLTGTPIRRYADDLYPHLRALHADALRKTFGIWTYQQFVDRFCVTTLKRFHARQRAQVSVTGNKNEADLRAFIYDNNIAVRRTIHDVAAHMPPLTVRDVSVDFDDDAELRAATGEALGAGEADPVMATARRLLGAAKAPYVASYVIDLWDQLSGAMLVFYWHREAGDIMQAKFEKAGLLVRRIDGSTSNDKRTRYEREFNEGRIDILLGQIASMGVAINLQQGSHYGVFAEMDWSPAAKDQALRRLWRLGQQTHVQIDICQADHPLDEAVSMVIDRKAIGAERIAG